MREISEILSQYNQHQNEHMQVQDYLARSEKSIQNSKGDASFQETNMWQDYFSQLYSKISFLKKKLHELRPALMEAQNKLYKAQAKRRALELMREKQKKEHQILLRKREAKEIVEYQLYKRKTSIGSI